MHFIQGTSRHQPYFATLADQVWAANSLRLIEVFIDKLELHHLGFTTTLPKSEGRPPEAPPVRLKLYLYGAISIKYAAAEN